LRLILAGVGRLRPAFRSACDEYLARLGRHAEVREVEVREAARAGAPVVQRREEARRLLAALPDGARVVALDPAGTPWSSERLATQLERWRDAGHAPAFVIGGAGGLDPALVDSAAHRWSLGPLTLPHELARVVVAEQLYRGFTILRGEPYHKGDSRAQ